MSKMSKITSLGYCYFIATYKARARLNRLAGSIQEARADVAELKNVIQKSFDESALRGELAERELSRRFKFFVSLTLYIN